MSKIVSDGLRCLIDVASKGGELKVLFGCERFCQAVNFADNCFSSPPMKPSTALQIHGDDIRRIVLKNGAQNPRVFGSALRGDDVDGSDLDILVDPVRGQTTLFNLASIQIEVEELTGVKTEVVTPMALHERFRADAVAQARQI